MIDPATTAYFIKEGIDIAGYAGLIAFPFLAAGFWKLTSKLGLHPSDANKQLVEAGARFAGTKLLEAHLAGKDIVSPASLADVISSVHASLAAKYAQTADQAGATGDDLAHIAASQVAAVLPGLAGALLQGNAKAA